MGLEDLIGVEVGEALEAAAVRRASVARIRAAFETHLLGAPAYLGLGRAYSGLFAAACGLTVERGWRIHREFARDVHIVMPLWLFALVRAWELRVRLVLRPLVRLGLWHVRGDCRYVDGRPTAPRWLRAVVWCFLNDQDRYEEPSLPTPAPKSAPNVAAFVAFAIRLKQGTP